MSTELASTPHRRRRRVVVVAVVLLCLGVGLVACGFNRGSSERPNSPHVSSDVRPSPQPRSPEIPSVDLADLRWTDYSGVSLPISARHGPRRVHDGLASGFARTPTGALLAALHIGVRANATWGPSIFEPTIQDQVVGPDQATLLANCRAAYNEAHQEAAVPTGRPPGRAYVVEEAFRFAGYTSTAATVDIVSAGPDDQGATVRAATRIELQWHGGDWRAVAPPGGDWGNSAAQVTDLSGYTLFSGQR